MSGKFAVFLALLLLAIGILPVAAQNDAEANKEAVRTALAALSSGNPDQYYDLFTEPYQMNESRTESETVSRADNEFFNGALLAAMPDLQAVPAVLIAQDDRVAVAITYTGTFTKPFSFPPISEAPFEPTNEPVTWTALDVVRFNDAGLVSEVYDMSDPAALFGQLGVFPVGDTQPGDAPLAAPAGYQALSSEDLAATLTSGMETRNLDLLNQQAALGFSGFPQFFANPYITWRMGEPFATTAVSSAEAPTFGDNLMQVMPDAHIDLVATVAEGDWTATIASITGTFTQDADVFGASLTATGEEISFLLGVIYRYDENGKIIEEWVDGDFSPLFIGLGLVGDE